MNKKFCDSIFFWNKMGLLVEVILWVIKKGKIILSLSMLHARGHNNFCITGKLKCLSDLSLWINKKLPREDVKGFISRVYCQNILLWSFNFSFRI